MGIPKITIITVVYNAVETIEQTILSVINQNYNNIEYIIIDGASTDGTIDVVKKYEDKVFCWISEPDKGIYDAMNKGVDIATGEWIYFLGSDDCLVHSRIIEEISFYLHDEIDLLSGEIWVVDEDLNLQLEYTNKFTIEDVFSGYRLPHQGMFVKNELLKSRRFNLEYKIVSDYDLFLNLYFNTDKKIKCISRKIAFYSNSGTSSTDIFLKIKEDVLIMKKYGFSERIISSYLSKYNRCFFLKCKLKKILNRLGILKKFLRKKKWKRHSCMWEKCRWCKK